ncbi:MAG: hypothetical protein DCC75_01755 [Proteobacteria bacterium]|nr:MAG: hypothetical protein DCC75_01755 [Pseudomonadota bacterium]
MYDHFVKSQASPPLAPPSDLAASLGVNEARCATELADVANLAVWALMSRNKVSILEPSDLSEQDRRIIANSIGVAVRNPRDILVDMDASRQNTRSQLLCDAISTLGKLGEPGCDELHKLIHWLAEQPFNSHSLCDMGRYARIAFGELASGATNEIASLSADVLPSVAILLPNLISSSQLFHGQGPLDKALAFLMLFSPEELKQTPGLRDALVKRVLNPAAVHEEAMMGIILGGFGEVARDAILSFFYRERWLVACKAASSYPDDPEPFRPYLERALVLIGHDSGLCESIRETLERCSSRSGDGSIPPSGPLLTQAEIDAIFDADPPGKGT